MLFINIQYAKWPLYGLRCVHGLEVSWLVEGGVGGLEVEVEEWTKGCFLFLLMFVCTVSHYYPQIVYICSIVYYTAVLRF